MKNCIYVFFIGLTLLYSCETANDYSVEIGYTVTGLKGDSILTNKQTYFTAANDSLAYLKGAQDFATASLQKIDTSGKPTKFSVRNNKGTVIFHQTK